MRKVRLENIVRSVGNSADLKRIVELPRRVSSDLEALAQAYTQALRRPGGTMVLHHLQALALHEARVKEGLFAPLAVGTGKGLLNFLVPMVMPSCKRAVLLIPASLRAQVLTVDYPLYSKHFLLPNLSNSETLRVTEPMPPVVYVLTYEELQHKNGADVLRQIDPDLVVADELHCLKHVQSVRCRRFLRFLTHTKSPVRFCGWSGTVTSKSVKEYSHLLALALGDESPVPLEPSVVEEWACALDAKPASLMLPGALRQLCFPAENVRQGFSRRLTETVGVVASAENQLGTSLEFAVRPAPPVPDVVTQALTRLRKSPTDGGWVRPDGEELVDALRVAACARELACGFFYRWKYPRGEAPAVIDRWFQARQDWNRDVRLRLQNAKPFLDSPEYCWYAAERYYLGGCPDCQRGPTETHYAGCGAVVTHPLWASTSWPGWHEVCDTVEPEQEAVWLSDYLLDDAAEWARSTTGIVWAEHAAFGRRMAQKHKLPYFGGGAQASAEIIREKGDRSIVASIKAHHAGKNLQTAFSRNLFPTTLTDESMFEQTVGRTHRQGQPEDVVTVELYQHIQEFREALSTMRDRARYVHETTRSARKLIYGSWRS